MGARVPVLAFAVLAIGCSRGPGSASNARIVGVWNGDPDRYMKLTFTFAPNGHYKLDTYRGGFHLINEGRYLLTDSHLDLDAVSEDGESLTPTASVDIVWMGENEMKFNTHARKDGKMAHLVRASSRS